MHQDTARTKVESKDSQENNFI